MKQRHGDFSTPNDRLTLTSKKTYEVIISYVTYAHIEQYYV